MAPRLSRRVRPPVLRRHEAGRLVRDRRRAAGEIHARGVARADGPDGADGRGDGEWRYQGGAVVEGEVRTNQEPRIACTWANRSGARRRPCSESYFPPVLPSD